jgi:drug/metabolite transporter (DMT)-like permease
MQRFYPFLFVFLWSTGFIGAKYGLPYAEPLSFLLTRYGFVIALMTAIALATRAPWPKEPKQVAAHRGFRRAGPCDLSRRRFCRHQARPCRPGLRRWWSACSRC